MYCPLLRSPWCETIHQGETDKIRIQSTKLVYPDQAKTFFITCSIRCLWRLYNVSWTLLKLSIDSYEIFFQLWCIASNQGYVYQFAPYPGPAEKATPQYNFGSSGNVAYFLATVLRKRFPDPHSLHITMDNYFSSIQLFESLKEDLNVTATGTVRINRVPNFPIDTSKLTKQPRGSYDSR